MKIGLISDTHGNLERTDRAVALLKAHGVGAVIHCGDIGSQAVLLAMVEAFDPPRIPAYAVLGNCDYDSFVGAGVEICDRFADLELDGKAIAVIHGDDASRFHQAIASQRFDFVFTGHTHVREDRFVGRTRVINPGAVHRAAQPGVAVLDTRSGELAWLDL